MRKKALITGVTGQDGSYLAEFLVAKGYEVHGIKRKSSSFNTARIDDLFSHHPTDFFLHYADMTDISSLQRVLAAVEPDEVYNLAAQSHVAVSFEMPIFTAEVNALGTLRLLEAIKHEGLLETVKFYQASTSELYGDVVEIPQTELTPFYPRSPYAVSKMFAYWCVVNYREAYGLFGCNGILFNHESERRGETFVTRKITRGLCRVALGLQSCVTLGNLDALRDWGHAADYVEAQWLMLQIAEPADLVIATGVQTSVREFIESAAQELGILIHWEGEGLQEIGVVAQSNNECFFVEPGQVIIRVDQRYFRPSEVDTLLGDATKARALLNWTPRVEFNDLCRRMIKTDLDLTQRSIIHLDPKL